ncbi:PIR protein, putative [Plasmodium sp.]|nr:PIR protein, putative [Plasmodium sp.]
MKLHYTNILLFSFPLNILADNKNKAYITLHTRTTTSRVLSEYDIQSSIYDNDADMKCVKENFDRQMSRRFEEYEERMITQRQKCKEQRDKDIQKIILKDKMEKSLLEKVEKGCLICACGLGGGVAPVWGLVSGLWYAAWKNYVSGVSAKAATDAGISKAIKGLGGIFGLEELKAIDWPKMIHAGNYSDKMSLIRIVSTINNMCGDGQAPRESLFCVASNCYTTTSRDTVFTTAISEKAVGVAVDAGKAARIAEAKEAANLLPKTIILSNNIIASIVAIVVIALVMLIIYLILRYRRKKKMKKKQQYTKLLKE